MTNQGVWKKRRRETHLVEKEEEEVSRKEKKI